MAGYLVVMREDDATEAYREAIIVDATGFITYLGPIGSIFPLRSITPPPQQVIYLGGHYTFTSSQVFNLPVILIADVFIDAGNNDITFKSSCIASRLRGSGWENWMTVAGPPEPA